MLSLFNISRFSSTVCSAAMTKRIQQESGEERVTAKSRPMMNLTARMPTVVSSSTSSSLGRTGYEYQDPGKSVVVDDRSGQSDRLSPAGYSKSDYERCWSSQEWKSEATTSDRSGKPDKTSWNAVQQVCPHHGDALLDGNAHSLRYGEIQILCWVLERSFNIRNPTKLGRKGLKGSQLIKAKEIMTVSMESRLNSSGTSSRIRYVAAL